MGGGADWKVGEVSGTENIVIDYEGKYCDEALREIAEKTGSNTGSTGRPSTSAAVNAASP